MGSEGVDFGVASSPLELMDELRNLGSWYPDTTYLDPVQSLRLLASKFNSPRFSPLYRELGLSIAGFTYIDARSKTRRYAFFSDAARSSGAGAGREIDADLGYMIRYQSYGWAADGEPPPNLETQDKFATAIDALFFVQRVLQDPFAKDPVVELAEYIRDLPIRPGVLGEVPDPIGLRSKNGNSALRTRFGIHYVPYGEMLGFMLMWRRLIRAIQALTGQPLWDPNTWGNIGSPFEENLVTMLAGAPPRRAGTRPSANELPFPPSTISHLRDLLDDIDGPDGTWEGDVRALGLVDSGHRNSLATHALRAFGASILGNCRAHVKAEGWRVVADNLLSHCGLVKAPMRELDLSAAGAALNKLHKVARFPILAYFYWAVISKRPRCHAVAPIWASLTAPIDLSTGFRSPIVGVAVVDVVPLYGLDDTVAGYADDERPPSSLRITLLTSMLRLIAQPHIDAVFYSTMQIEKDRGDDRSATVQAAIHDAINNASALLDALDLADIGDSPGGVRVALARDLQARLTLYGRLATNDAPIYETTIAEVGEAGQESENHLSLKVLIGRELTRALAFALLRQPVYSGAFLAHYGLDLSGLLSDMSTGQKRFYSQIQEITGIKNQVALGEAAVPDLTYVRNSVVEVDSRLTAGLQVVLAGILDFQARLLFRPSELATRLYLGHLSLGLEVGLSATRSDPGTAPSYTLYLRFPRVVLPPTPHTKAVPALQAIACAARIANIRVFAQNVEAGEDVFGKYDEAPLEGPDLTKVVWKVSGLPLISIRAR